MADFEIGDLVGAKKFGPMDHDFTGIVEKVYTNSLMISIQDFEPSDKNGVNELNNRAVIRQSEAKMIKAVPRTEKKEEDEEVSDDKSVEKKTTKKSEKKADK
ncbi:hypothetical protein AALA17_03835 [Lactobacillaceae bacterium 24-114]